MYICIVSLLQSYPFLCSCVKELKEINFKKSWAAVNVLNTRGWNCVSSTVIDRQTWPPGWSKVNLICNRRQLLRCVVRLVLRSAASWTYASVVLH